MQNTYSEQFAALDDRAKYALAFASFAPQCLSLFESGSTLERLHDLSKGVIEGGFSIPELELGIVGAKLERDRLLRLAFAGKYAFEDNTTLHYEALLCNLKAEDNFRQANAQWNLEWHKETDDEALPVGV